MRSSDHLEALANFNSLPADARVRPAVFAALLAVSPETLRRWTGDPEKGLPEPIRTGGVVTYRVSDVRAVLGRPGK